MSLRGLRHERTSYEVQKTSVSVILEGDIESPEVRQVIKVWEERRHGRQYPTREELLPGPLRNLLQHISLVRVIGDDYEFRIVGHAHVLAYGVWHQGMKLSDTIKIAPSFGKLLKASFDRVRSTGTPLMYRGFIGQELGARFVWFETCYLPLGAAEVDHILVASTYAPKDGRWPEP